MDPQFPSLEDVQMRVERIKQLPLGAQPRGELLLVLLGEKPATEITARNSIITSEDLMEVLRSVGLNVERGENKKDSYEIFVGCDAQTVARLMYLNASRDHDAYGALMGFPSSAREAFLSPQERLDEVEQRALLADLPFFHFRLSKKGKQDEVALIARWNVLIFERAPELIDEVWGEKEAGRFKDHLRAIAREGRDE